MRTIRLLAALCLGASSGSAALADEAGIRIVYSERLLGLEIERAPAARGSDTMMQFDAFGRRLRFRLEPNRALVRRESGGLADDVEVYRGEVDGKPGSWARFTVVDGQPLGMFFDGTELFAVESPDRRTGLSSPVVYRLADLEISPGTLRCSHGGQSRNAMQLLSAVSAETSRPAVQNALDGTPNLDVALVADFEFTDEFGADTNAELLARMNIVDEIFSQQLGIRITVSHIDTYPTSNDPFSNETNSSLLLEELSEFRFGSDEQRAAGITHMFTGRSLDGNNVGIAFRESLCSGRFGAALTALQRGEFFGSIPVDALIAAHEIGHNFGAPHDGEIGSACAATTLPRLMSVQVNGSDQFSACSITEMQDDIDAASCIQPLVGVDVEVLAGVVPVSVNNGAGVQVRFEVNNLGLEAANNVALGITTPATVLLDGVSATAGTCTSGAGTVDCTLGSIPARTGITVTLETTAQLAGGAAFVATATGDGDEILTNNSSTAAFTVIDPSPLPSANDGEEGGGGAPGWLLLALLGSATAARRRRVPG